jgi:hypothetical protein
MASCDQLLAQRQTIEDVGHIGVVVLNALLQY